MSIETEHTGFKREAKSIVDSLFENKLFREDLTRDDMQALEDWIYTVMDMRFTSEKKISKLMEKINKDEN